MEVYSTKEEEAIVADDFMNYENICEEMKHYEPLQWNKIHSFKQNLEKWKFGFDFEISGLY